MKVRLTAATIAIYFLFTIFVLSVYTNASKDEILDKKWKTIRQFRKNPHPLTTCFIFPHVNQFLTIKDIFIFQNTHPVFQNLLQKSCQNMVSFRKYPASDEINYTTIIWNDLKYFLKESYTIFNDMEMFNIKKNEYAVLTHPPGNEVLTRPPENKIIVWNNNVTPYPQILRNQIMKNAQLTHLDDYFSNNDLEPLKMFNKKESAWAILTNEGNVITGGNEDDGGKIPDDIQSKLKNVKMIVSTCRAFAALLNDGSVVAWGDYVFGGTIPEDIKPQVLQDVKMISSTWVDIAALLNDGHVCVWGPNVKGTFTIDIQAQLKNVKIKCIFSSFHAFVALLDNGDVVVWGDFHGKIRDGIQSKLKNVKMIFSTPGAFVALLNNGSVIAWGDHRLGGEIPDDIQSQLFQNVKMIIPTSIFTAILNNGTTCTWPKRPKYQNI